MTSLHAIGSSAVGAYRQALAATAQNVANAETPGYVRRTARLEEIGPVAGGSGVGAFVGGIERGWDGLLAADWRSSISDAGAGAAQAQWAGRVERATTLRPVGEPDSLASFFAAATRLAAHPGDTTARALFLQSLDAVAQEFRTIGEGLASEKVSLDGAVTASVGKANALLADLDNTNHAIQRTRPGSDNYAQLLDRRDAALIALSGEIAVEVRFADNGIASVATLDGTPLLGDGVVARLAIDGGALAAISDAGTAVIAPGGGGLGGLLFAQDDLAAIVAQSDGFAMHFVEAINNWSAGGADAGGARGTPLLAGSSAAGIALIADDPAAVPAASATSANGNLLALDGLRPGLDSGFAALRSETAVRTAALKQSEARLTERRDAAALALDAVAGVDLDREAADMLRLQQAYGASARILQVANSLLDTIIGLN